MPKPTSTLRSPISPTAKSATASLTGSNARSALHPGTSESVKEAKRAYSKRFEDAYYQSILGSDIPVPMREFVFAPPRRWRFDFAWPLMKLFVEIDGAVWAQGRHTRGSGFVKDMEKFNAATLLGWRGLHFTPDDVKSGHALTLTHRLLLY